MSRHDLYMRASIQSFTHGLSHSVMVYTISLICPSAPIIVSSNGCAGSNVRRGVKSSELTGFLPSPPLPPLPFSLSHTYTPHLTSIAADVEDKPIISKSSKCVGVYAVWWWWWWSVCGGGGGFVFCKCVQTQTFSYGVCVCVV